MLKGLKHTAFNYTILITVICSMVICTVFSVNFSSIFYVLICGCIGIGGFLMQRISQRK